MQCQEAKKIIEEILGPVKFEGHFNKCFSGLRETQQKELINWIKSEEAQGYTPKQLYNSLIQQGYDPNEINEAIGIVSQSSQQTNQSTEPMKKP